ncbi:727_t:CDS:2 [Gigaspora margarita]|uniref:727_t:CDS:1 n=1 Tax=Gigaspora margarita TaxID=4874 RepID=A0ABN7V7N3_GIGMA|nr:727_t:CDS:2 [Gigaspora margarita]
MDSDKKAIKSVVHGKVKEVLEETIERGNKRSKAQHIHENMPLYLQNLYQNTETEPIMLIEIIGRTWEEKADNAFEEIETPNSRI